MPPPFIAPDSAGGKLVFTPKLDKTYGGLSVNMNLRGQDLGLTKAAVESLNTPIGVDGESVGFKVKLQDQLPAGFPPSPQGEAALFLSIDTTGTVDFGNSASFASPSALTFKVPKSLNLSKLSDGLP